MSVASEMNSYLVEKRVESIDGLRGGAILLVLITHIWTFSGAPALSFTVNGHVVLLASIPAIGHIGVNLFLVLSGFCLTRPFLTGGSGRSGMSIWSFWWRRVKRICPAYYISIIVVVLARAAVSWLQKRAGQWPSMNDILLHLAFLHNTDPRYANSINGSYWSIALEFQLYLLFPFLHEGVRRIGIWKFLALCIGLQFTYRLALNMWLTADVAMYYDFVLAKGLVGRLVDFASGIVAAHIVSSAYMKRGLRKNVVQGVMFASLVGGFLLNYFSIVSEPYLDILWAVGFSALVVVASVDSWWSALFSSRWIVNMGLMSFSIYLLHQPLVEGLCFVIQSYMKPGKTFFVVLAISPLVVGICYAFYCLVERPFLVAFARRASQERVSGNLQRVVHVGQSGVVGV